MRVLGVPSIALLSTLAVSVAAVEQVEVHRRAAIPLMLSNDDGWAEANIRALYLQTNAAGYDVLLSAPAQDESGTGSSTTTPTPLTQPGEFDSIPTGSPAEGHNVTDDHLWYVNAYPVDAVQFGLQNLSSIYLGGPPTLVLTGPNVGNNLGIATLFSGTVGAACEASLEGVPSIAFSAATGTERAWYTLQSGDYSFIYADGAVRLVEALLAGGAPYLPSGTSLNVNFPAAGPGTSCTSASDFNFVLSRVYSVLGLPVDVETCGSNSLPTESDVVGTSGCYASVSVFNASTKLDVSAASQQAVLDQLGDFLTCLPS